MATVAPNSGDTPTDKENNLDSRKELDAGALFVLKSRGSWLHCGYHLTTAIVAPALLSLPFAMAMLGWVGGVMCLMLGALVTFYSYNLLSLVLEHHAQLGKRQLRFRDMAHDILGPGWGRYFVNPLQLGICYGAVIACILLGGQSLKFIYLLSKPDGTMELYQFVAIFGSLTILLAQMPSFHSLRHINLVSLVLCLAYCACTTAGAIYIDFVVIVIKRNEDRDYQFLFDSRMFQADLGAPKAFYITNSFRIFMVVILILVTFHSLLVIRLLIEDYFGESKNAPAKNYDVTATGVNRLFGVFNAISIIATTYGNGIIPEIQATLAPPIKGKMFKGLLVCYAVVISTFSSVGISGYWAFGNQSQGSILQNFMVNGKPLVNKWFLLMTNVFTLVQVIAVVLTYLQPSNVVLERKFADPKMGEFSIRNVVPRLIFRSLSIAIATLLAAMLPFFGDIMALFGAFGCIPLDFILPMVFYNFTFKPSKKSIVFWGNTFIAVISTVLSLVGAVASVRQIFLDAKTYRLFANM